MRARALIRDMYVLHNLYMCVCVYCERYPATWSVLVYILIGWLANWLYLHEPKHRMECATLLLSVVSKVNAFTSTSLLIKVSIDHLQPNTVYFKYLSPYDFQISIHLCWRQLPILNIYTRQISTVSHVIIITINEAVVDFFFINLFSSSFSFVCTVRL